LPTGGGVRVARSPAPYYPQTTEDQAHSRLTSAITAPQTPRWRPPAAGDCAAQPLTGTRCAALLGTCARARATRRQAPSNDAGAEPDLLRLPSNKGKGQGRIKHREACRERGRRDLRVREHDVLARPERFKARRLCRLRHAPVFLVRCATSSLWSVILMCPGV
jgi:hypothetical protein